MKIEGLSKFGQLMKENSKNREMITINPNRRLLSTYKKYNQDRKNAHSKGNYLGNLFEQFITPLLIKTAYELDSVKWIVPAGQYIKTLDHSKRKNLLSYSKEGELVIFDSDVKAADFDGILKIGRQIILIEQKYNLHGGNIMIKRVLSRMKLFHAAYGNNPHILFIIPSDIKNFSFRDRYEAHPQISILEIDYFQKYRKMFEKKKFPNDRISLSEFSSKVREPHVVFPKLIKFANQRKKLKVEFNQKLKRNSSAKEFFHRNKDRIDLVSRFALGQIDPECSLNGKINDPYNTWKDYHEQKIPRVLFIKFREPQVYPEIVAYKKEGRGRIKRLKRSRYSYTSQEFSIGKRDVAERTLTYSLTKKVATTKKKRLINSRQLKNIILRS